jgi:hypothetical protein
VTRSKYSHVGLVWRSRADDLVLVLESTTLSTAPDLSSGRFRAGVQLSLLSQRLGSYEGEIYLRRFMEIVDQDRLELASRFRREFYGRPYEKSQLDLLGAAFGWGGEEDLSSVFCSELVAEFYQRWGVLDSTPPSDNYSPADFARPEVPFLGPVVRLLPTEGRTL